MNTKYVSLLLVFVLVITAFPVQAEIDVVEDALPTLYAPIFEYPFDFTDSSSPSYDPNFDWFNSSTWGDHLIGWISWEYLTGSSIHVQWEITHGLTPNNTYWGSFEGYLGDGTVYIQENFGEAIADNNGALSVDVYWDLPQLCVWYAVEWWLKEEANGWLIVATNEFNPVWWNSDQGDQPPWFPSRPPNYLVEPDNTPPVTNEWEIEEIAEPYASLLSLYNMAPEWVWNFSWSYQSIVFKPVCEEICGLTPGFWKTNAAKDLDLLNGKPQVPKSEYIALLEEVIENYGWIPYDWDNWNITSPVTDEDLAWALALLSNGAIDPTDYPNNMPDKYSNKDNESDDPQVKARRQLLALMLSSKYLKDQGYLGAYISVPGYNNGWMPVEYWIDFALKAYNAFEFEIAYDIATFLNENCATLLYPVD